MRPQGRACASLCVIVVTVHYSLECVSLCPSLFGREGTELEACGSKVTWVKKKKTGPPLGPGAADEFRGSCAVPLP